MKTISPNLFQILILGLLISANTFAQVGIGTTDPKGAFHIYEATGTAPTPNTGTIVLEHGNNGGTSSVIFKSKANAGSDYAYISYSDDGSGNGNTSENALLTIGIENDVSGAYQDDINIASSGSLGINNSSPNGSSSIDLGANNKGLLLNRVALSSTTNSSSPISNPVAGMIVYNTATNGSGSTKVQPGIYYWDGSSWNRIFNKGYSVQYNQTNEARASSNTSTYVSLPGLTNNNFTAPYTGKYQIILNGYHSSGSPTNSSYNGDLENDGSLNTAYTVLQQDAASQGSLRIRMNNTTIGEKYVTSVSKSFPGQTFYSLGQNLTIIVNVDLIAGQNYEFDVEGREWARYNGDRGYFGRTTNVYAGANGVSTAQYGDLTITLISEN